jgi:tetratricopeptide (TPR) repeat protein
MALSLNHLGVVAAARGDYATSRSFEEESLTIFREVGDYAGAGSSLLSLGDVVKAQGDYATTRALYEESLTIWRDLGNRSVIPVGLLHLGKVAQLQGEQAAAQAYYAESLMLFQELRDRRQTLSALTGVGTVLIVQASARPAVLARAVRVLGAAAALLDQLGTVLTIEERPPHAEQALAAARTALGEGEFAAAWATGQRLTLEQAIAEALHPVDE